MSEEPKEPGAAGVIRLSQKKIDELIEKGEMQIGSPKKEIPSVAELIKTESDEWENFLGEKRTFTSPPKELFEILKRTRGKGIDIFEPHYLPIVFFSRDSKYPGWDVKPEDFLWKQMGGNIESGSAGLTGQWILIDKTQKPDKKNEIVSGTIIAQHSYDDPQPLRNLLKKLRKENKLNPPPFAVSEDSRFGLSWNDIHELVLPELARTLQIPKDYIRLPRLIEFNVLGNIFYQGWGRTTTSELFEDRYGKLFVLKGGDNQVGGLGETDYIRTNAGYSGIGFRPIIVVPNPVPNKTFQT